MRQYFLSTRAHNTVEVDRKDFSRQYPETYGSGLRNVTPEGTVWIIEAEAPHLRNGYTHRRRVLFQPGRFLLSVDRVTATGVSARPENRLFTNWWHFNPELKLSRGANSAAWLVSGLTGRRRLHVSHATSAKELRGACHMGEMEPRPQGWVSRAYLEYEPAPALGILSEDPHGLFRRHALRDHAGRHHARTGARVARLGEFYRRIRSSARRRACVPVLPPRRVQTEDRPCASLKTNRRTVGSRPRC